MPSNLIRHLWSVAPEKPSLRQISATARTVGLLGELDDLFLCELALPYVCHSPGEKRYRLYLIFFDSSGGYCRGIGISMYH